MAHALFGPLLLGLILEQEFQDMPAGEVGSQIIKGTVASTSGTRAIGFATGGEALDVRGAQQVGRDNHLAQESCFALAQRQSRGAAEIVYLSHDWG